MSHEEILKTVAVVSFVAGTISAALPAPKTKAGKAIRKIIDFLGQNFGNAKNGYTK